MAGSGTRAGQAGTVDDMWCDRVRSLLYGGSDGDGPVWDCLHYYCDDGVQGSVKGVCCEGRKDIHQNGDASCAYPCCEGC